MTSHFTGIPLTSTTSPRIRILGALLVLVALALPALGQKASDKPAVDSLYKQGIRSLQGGDLAAARSAFEKVVRLAPNAPEGHNSLGWVLMKTGKLEEAIGQFRLAIKLNPDFVQAHINLANALSSRKDTEGAASEARTAVKLAPNDAEAHRTLGRALSFRQELPAAIAELQRAAGNRAPCQGDCQRGFPHAAPEDHQRADHGDEWKRFGRKAI